MSEITQNIVVQPNNINVTVDNNTITFTPTDINMNIFAGGVAVPGGDIGALQYNNNGIMDGVPTANYVSGNLSLGNVANIKITGGTNGYVMQTDGSGNLTWTAQTGGGGSNGLPGGSNTQIQYNDSGAFGGNAGFTFDEITGNVNIPGNLIVSGVFAGAIANANYAAYAGNVILSNQPIITSLGNLTNLNTANANLGNTATANYYIGNVYTNTQPYITSLGNLDTLTVLGTTTIQQAKEKVTANSTGSTGTIQYDLLSQAILLKTTNSTSDFQLNFRGNSSVRLDTVMNSNQSLTCTFINTNGANAYYANIIAIDGLPITPKWVYPGAPTVGQANGQDVYTFNIIKTAANTYNVLAARTGFV